MAYLAFPFLVPLIFRAGVRTKLALAIALLTALAWLAFWTKDDFNQWDGPRTLLRCLPEFTAGMLLYDLYLRRSWPSCLQRDWLFLLILGSLLLLLHVGAADLLIILLFPAVMMAAVSNTGYVAGLANTRPLVWLGNISYSLYLIHGFVQFLMTKLLSAVPLASPANISPITALALTAAMLCASLLLATATYFAVERVGRRYLRNVFGVPTQSTARQLRATEYTDEKMDHERRPGTVQDLNLAT
jgi:peptidoglycan/LPS O-acetylase OafA/YrhL